MQLNDSRTVEKRDYVSNQYFVLKCMRRQCISVRVSTMRLILLQKIAKCENIVTPADILRALIYLPRYLRTNFVPSDTRAQ